MRNVTAMSGLPNSSDCALMTWNATASLFSRANRVLRDGAISITPIEYGCDAC